MVCHNQDLGNKKCNRYKNTRRNKQESPNIIKKGGDYGGDKAKRMHKKL